MTLGNVISFIGKVSMRVDTGLEAQLWKASLISITAAINPVKTIRIQNSLEHFLVDPMYNSPWIDEDSK